MKILIDNIKNYDENDYQNWTKFIKKEKNNKISKILNIVHKKESLLGEKLLKDGLLKFYNLDYSKLNFGYTKNKKPYIKNKNIYYNISHSNGIVVIAFNETPIGVDIEKIRKVDIKTIDKFATFNEKNYILKKNVYDRLFSIYTLKESYFKMKGTDLKDIFNIEFTKKNNKITCQDKSIAIHEIKRLKGYKISICIKN